MKYTKYITSAAGLLGLGAILVACTPAPTMKTGYDYAIPETQAMQDDDFSNPAFVWVDIGEEQWSTVDGEAGKSCESCHGDASSMKGISTSYPKYSAEDGKMRTLQHQINYERTERMKAKAWKWEGDEMLGMASFIKNQSKGMPLNVSIEGEAAPFYEAGKAFYMQRRGGLDMSCKNCHMDYPGVKIRANVLTNGLPNGFPTYRLKWQKIGSLHRRFRGCNSNIRATPYKQGSDEYTNLELFLTHRANGVAVETPAVRN
ncbi:MAG: sulfur oxidation c-type cytochrome SoxA [Rhodospirillaceae bacterium]|nr:sulfur oxidation c-type cytochrome SoxA [Rhodospirillaceae bacterium]MBL6930212.1 sulfur oxidation c-type cytochrome SoxA [Rhodospirillales bacterium]MBL6940785.1 sulfur oxidation c-type cytochrome SoxA [Rhodospirillales bacterium]